MGKNLLAKSVSIIAWLTGVLVSLAVGFGMVDGVLGVRYVPAAAVVWAGWIVVILTIVGVILALMDYK